MANKEFPYKGREAEIVAAAEEDLKTNLSMGIKDPNKEDMRDCARGSFILGAKWADKHPDRLTWRDMARIDQIIHECNQDENVSDTREFFYAEVLRRFKED